VTGTTGAGELHDAADTGMGHAGARLREIRQQRGMSLLDVAEKAEVTKGFLSLAERGRSNVSVPVLMRICNALEIGIADLFEYPREPVVRSGAGAPLEMGGHDVQELLLTPENERHVQVMLTRMRPHGGSGGAYRLDAISIFVYVLKGSLAITVDGTATTQLHDWHNPTDGESEVLWAIVPPIPHEQFRIGFRGD
jgi:transcriptional regulator with XRE-family HTH domain